MAVSTNTDLGGGAEWRIDDEPLHLREWASTVEHLLPTGDATIGSLETCWLPLKDPSGRVSKTHARLSRDDGKWLLTDLQSKNGIRQDGARRMSFRLSPGVEIGIGGLTLVAESARFIALRDLLRRLIGWGSNRRTEVDLALRAVRLAATRRDSLLLCGEGDLISLAQHLHRHTLGDERPFVVCDPRRRRAEPTARAAANYDSGLVALGAASGGTLCVWANRQPEDFGAVLTAVREPTSQVQLVVCTHALVRSEPLTASPVIIPNLAERGDEVDDIIAEYGREAVAALGGAFTETDHGWVVKEEAGTLAQIEKATRRLVAIRAAGGSITRAALALDMSHGALSEWIARRNLPA